MKALQIILTQNTANYGREETVDNRMTYPLPPLSTVIGALHNACNYKEYHPMDISIQGSFGALNKKVYTHHCWLDSLQNDRNHLVYVANSNMMASGIPVASALATQKNDFEKGITIKEEDKDLIKLYRSLKQVGRSFDEYKQNDYAAFESKVAEAKNEIDKKIKSEVDTQEKEKYKKQKKELSLLKKECDNVLKVSKENQYDLKMTHFKTLATSLKSCEILSDVRLIIHIHSDENTLSDIYNHIYNLRSLGRSEDFVQVEAIQYVDLIDNFDVKEDYEKDMQMYIDYSLIADKTIKCCYSGDVKMQGTAYFLNKNYKILNGKRIFEKKRVVYISNFEVAKNAKNLYLTADKKYLVNLL